MKSSLRPFSPVGVLAAVFLAVLLSTASVPAVQVRIASYNVKQGLDTSSNRASYAGNREDDYWQVLDSIARVQPDIVGFAELNSYDFDNLPALASALGYPYIALFSDSMNDNTYRQGVMSKFEIVARELVKENKVDPDAAEIKRWPIHATIAVPGALNPLHVFVVHTHPGTTAKEHRLWRAMNAWRMRQYLSDMNADLPDDVEYVVMGDFNENAYGSVGAGQHESFTYDYYLKRLNSGNLFGSWFHLGSDFPWSTNQSFVLPYKLYPTERFNDLSPVSDTFRTGLESAADRATFPATGQTLDYILFSDEIVHSAYGAPQCEVYWASNDLETATVGLSKPGPWLETLSIGPSLTVNSNGLDHLMVFGDFHMIDAVPGLTPVAIISEVAVRSDRPSANFVEISNTGAAPLKIDGYSLDFHYRDNSEPAFTISLSGSIPAGGSWWAAPRADWASNNWHSVLASNGLSWSPPDVTSSHLYSTNFDGRGAVVLRNAAGAILDVFGASGNDGLGKSWYYADYDVTRVPGVTDPIDTWSGDEWVFSPLPSAAAAATPGHHDSISAADVAVSSLSLSPAVPVAGDPLALTAVIAPNALASNLVLTAHFSVNGNFVAPSWTDGFALTNVSGNVWAASGIALDAAPGDAVVYRLQVAFDGPGGLSPAFSSQCDYVFPALSDGTDRLATALFNEVAPTAASPFLEFAGAAGLDLEGWTVEHWCIAEDGEDLLWSWSFPSGAALPDAPTVDDEWGNPVAFLAVSADDYDDFSLADDVPAALVLRTPSGTVADAVAWLPAASPDAPYAVDFLPDTVLSAVIPQGLPNYLHVLGPAPASSSLSLQAPDWILTGRATNALVRLVQWSAAAPTRGALNANQVEGDLALLRVDSDADALPDDEDNCPASPNPTQADIDADGIGDECDPDMDGDDIPNFIDNCPYTPNPEQEDSDGDGTGDACDEDFDSDLVPPHEAFFVTFEDVPVANLSASTPSVFDDGGRSWVFLNAAVKDTASDRKIGAHSARFAPGGTLTLSGLLTNGLSSVAFFYAPYGNATNTPDLILETSADGQTWDYLQSVRTSVSTNLMAARFDSIGIAEPVHFRIRVGTNAASGRRVNLDNLRIVSNVRATADADVVSDLVLTYDGAAHTNSFVVTPASAAWSVVYTNAAGDVSAAPSAVGVWTAVLTVETTDAVLGGTFVFPSSLVIEALVLPPVLTPSISAATPTWAMLSGTIVPNRDDPLPVLFEYGLTTRFGTKVLADESPVSGYASLPVGVVISNLLPSTRYYWRILAADVVTETKDFYTDELPVPELSDSIVEAREAYLEWPRFDGATNYILSVYTQDGSATAQTIVETFADWDAFAYPSIDDLNNHKSTYHTQQTAAGLWSSTNVAVYPTDSGSGPGSAGRIQLYKVGSSSDSWLQFPPIDGIETLSCVLGNTNPRGNANLAVQVSTDGGATFSTVTNYSFGYGTISRTNVWASPLPAGAILRFANTGNRGVLVYDISVSTAASPPVYLSGYPLSVPPDGSDCTVFLVTGLAPETTYHVSLVAQGPGWESEPSADFLFTTPSSTPYEDWLAALGLSPSDYPSGNDTDGDGISNGREYLAGTDPSDPDSRFDLARMPPAVSASDVVWTYPGSTTRVYRLLVSSNLVHWVTNAVLLPDPDTGDVSFTNSLLETLFSRLQAFIPEN